MLTDLGAVHIKLKASKWQPAEYPANPMTTKLTHSFKYNKIFKIKFTRKFTRQYFDMAPQTARLIMADPLHTETPMESTWTLTWYVQVNREARKLVTSLNTTEWSRRNVKFYFYFCIVNFALRFCIFIFWVKLCLSDRYVTTLPHQETAQEGGLLVV